MFLMVFHFPIISLFMIIKYQRKIIKSILVTLSILSSFSKLKFWPNFSFVLSAYFLDSYPLLLFKFFGRITHGVWVSKILESVNIIYFGLKKSYFCQVLYSVKIFNTSTYSIFFRTILSLFLIFRRKISNLILCD